MIRYGDTIEAIPGTVAAMSAEGRLGRVVEVRDPKGYSGNNSNNLVVWGDDIIYTGFHMDQVRKVERA